MRPEDNNLNKDDNLYDDNTPEPPLKPHSRPNIPYKNPFGKPTFDYQTRTGLAAISRYQGLSDKNSEIATVNFGEKMPTYRVSVEKQSPSVIDVLEKIGSLTDDDIKELAASIDVKTYQTKLGEGAKQMFFDGVGFKTKVPANKAEILSKMREAVKQNGGNLHISNQFPAKLVNIVRNALVFDKTQEIGGKPYRSKRHATAHMGYGGKKEGALQNLQFLAERNQKIDQEIGQEIKDKQQQTNAQQAQDNKIKMGSKYKGSVTSFSDAGIAGYIAGEGNMNVVMREAVEEYNKDKDKSDQIIFVNAPAYNNIFESRQLGKEGTTNEMQDEFNYQKDELKSNHEKIYKRITAANKNDKDLQSFKNDLRKLYANTMKLSAFKKKYRLGTGAQEDDALSIDDVTLMKMACISTKSDLFDQTQHSSFGKNFAGGLSSEITNNHLFAAALGTQLLGDIYGHWASEGGKSNKDRASMVMMMGMALDASAQQSEHWDLPDPVKAKTSMEALQKSDPGFFLERPTLNDLVDELAKLQGSPTDNEKQKKQAIKTIKKKIEVTKYLMVGDNFISANQSRYHALVSSLNAPGSDGALAHGEFNGKFDKNQRNMMPSILVAQYKFTDPDFLIRQDIECLQADMNKGPVYKHTQKVREWLKEAQEKRDAFLKRNEGKSYLPKLDDSPDAGANESTEKRVSREKLQDKQTFYQTFCLAESPATATKDEQDATVSAEDTQQPPASTPKSIDDVNILREWRALELTVMELEEGVKSVDKSYKEATKLAAKNWGIDNFDGENDDHYRLYRAATSDGGKAIKEKKGAGAFAKVCFDALASYEKLAGKLTEEEMNAILFDAEVSQAVSQMATAPEEKFVAKEKILQRLIDKAQDKLTELTEGKALTEESNQEVKDTTEQPNAIESDQSKQKELLNAIEPDQLKQKMLLAVATGRCASSEELPLQMLLAKLDKLKDEHNQNAEKKAKSSVDKVSGFLEQSPKKDDFSSKIKSKEDEVRQTYVADFAAAGSSMVEKNPTSEQTKAMVKTKVFLKNTCLERSRKSWSFFNGKERSEKVEASYNQALLLGIEPTELEKAIKAPKVKNQSKNTQPTSADTEESSVSTAIKSDGISKKDWPSGITRAQMNEAFLNTIKQKFFVNGTKAFDQIVDGDDDLKRDILLSIKPDQDAAAVLTLAQTMANDKKINEIANKGTLSTRGKEKAAELKKAYENLKNSLSSDETQMEVKIKNMITAHLEDQTGGRAALARKLRRAKPVDVSVTDDSDNTFHSERKSGSASQSRPSEHADTGNQAEGDGKGLEKGEEKPLDQLKQQVESEINASKIRVDSIEGGRDSKSDPTMDRDNTPGEEENTSQDNK